MKTSRLVGEAYDFIEPLQLLAIGDFPDITAAFYNGNYKKTFAQAQEDKHEWILSGLEFKAGEKILDIGCGWGPMLKEIKERGGKGIGLTVSRKQADYCANKGLTTLLQDWKEVTSKNFEKFDGVVSLGAFEHFCSPEEYTAGRQKQIYNDFFKFCYNYLNDSGRLFLQTMTWGEKVFRPEELNLQAQLNSPKRIVSVLLSLSSWFPPISKDQIIETASPYLRLVNSNNGRMDYVQTFKDWYQLLEKAQKRNLKLRLYVAKNSLANKNFRRLYGYWQESLQGQYFKRAFEQRLLNHERMFFEKI